MAGGIGQPILNAITVSAGTKACEDSGACIAQIPIGTSTSCLISNAEGCYELPGKLNEGSYTISIQGCKSGSSKSLFGSIPQCSELDSVAFSFGGVDLFDIPAAQNFKETEAWRRARSDAINRYACRGPLQFEEKDNHFGEDAVSFMLAKLYIASDPGMDCVKDDRLQMASQVNDFLFHDEKPMCALGQSRRFWQHRQKGGVKRSDADPIPELREIVAFPP